MVVWRDGGWIWNLQWRWIMFKWERVTFYNYNNSWYLVCCGMGLRIRGCRRRKIMVFSQWKVHIQYYNIFEESMVHWLFSWRVWGVWQNCYRWLNVSSVLPEEPEPHFWQHTIAEIKEKCLMNTLMLFNI